MYEKVFSDLFSGFKVTIELFVLTLLISLPLGLIICFGARSRFAPLRVVIRFFVWIIRGTPLMLQLIIFFYGPGLISNWASQLPDANFFTAWLASWSVMDRFTSAVIMFSINYACYFSEIYRGGLESIPRGQYEAGLVLGMTRSQVFFRIILLQVVKHILPPISNEVITLVKDTSIARVISVYEIMWMGESFIKSRGMLWPMLATGLFYLLFSGLLTLLFGKLEKKLSYFRS